MSAPLRDPLVFERTLPASIETVFEAWRDPEALAVWMRPGELGPSDVEVDFRVGGRFRIAMKGESQDFVHEGEYLEIEAPNRLVLTWVSTWMPAEHRKTRITVHLEALAEDRTRLLMVHEQIPAVDLYDGHPDGWTRILERLETLVAAS